MKNSVILCFLLQFGKTSWSKNISELFTNATNLKANLNLTQIVNGTNDYRRRELRGMKKLLGGESKKDKDDYYEPYHEGGEKVYLLPTRKPPQIQKGQKTIPPSSPPTFTFEDTDNQMQIYRDCDRDCPTVFQDFYGVVCGFRFNTMTYKNEYRVFNDLCELQYFNCKFPEARPSWVVIHRGKCPELTTFRPFPNNTLEPIDRAVSWLDRSFVIVTHKRNHKNND